ncbi:hypothetical protein [Mastigocoleus sp. MO_188.B34]|uniref:hypothetical protein n=1 Tax=Mastigocoleus sp. MO_188.B34 TaxID=3036635 RepID=UPI00262A485B|nr:hypothetical protein [Mastigocoleus sp. MO_188.B34]MDJ0695087.1 hypothetical protein [Mastigocoleus sp. MO_188.B34]
MSPINLLAIFNPSNYSRTGYFTLPWEPIYKKFQIPSEELVLSDLHDLSHKPINAQVDRLDPEDPSRDLLVFSLAKPIYPGSESERLASGFIRLARGKAIPQKVGEAYVDVVYGDSGQVRGVRLVNSRLIVWLNLIPSPEDNECNWFSGSASSVQLDREEILDPFLAAKGEWLGQDPEKRCMQISEVLLPGSSYPKSPHYRVSLFNHSYRLISQSSGSVRASVTIASEPFDYIGADPVTGANRHLVCELYRVISLYAGADYLIEELFVKGKPKDIKDSIVDSSIIVNVDFAARYFAHMDMGNTEDIEQVFPRMDWFAVGSMMSPYPAYGFATDVHIDSVTHPYEEKENWFSWQLLPGNSAKCLHLFMRDRAEGFDARVGHAWYEMIYHPLKARVYSDIAVSNTDLESDNTDVLALTEYRY